MKRRELTQGQQNILSAMDWVCAILLALLPLFQHYRGLIGLVADAFLANILPTHYVNLADNLSITSMIVMAPYLAVRALVHLKKGNFKGLLLVSPLLAFYLFKVVDHGTSVAELLQAGLSVGFVVVLGLGCIDTKKLINVATVIACISGVVIIAQYICYYIFDFHLQVIPVKLLLPSAEQWIGLAETGRISVTGIKMAFYRPASIFMEPSHLFIYSFPLLFINLYKTGKKILNWIAAALISIAIVLSTSGMGVAVVFGVWVLFAALWDEESDSIKLSTLKKFSHWARGICAAVALMILFLNVPSINYSIARIIGRRNISISMFFPSDNTQNGVLQAPVDNTGTQSTEEGMQSTDIAIQPTEPSKTPIISDRNAITGRTKGAIKILKSMSLKQWIIGCADSTAGTGTNMPGFMATLYKYGIIGLLLSYIFFAYGLVKFNAGYFCATAIWFIVSFFSTHTHGMIYILYYIMLFYNGFEESKNAWLGEFKEMFQKIFYRRAK